MAFGSMGLERSAPAGRLGTGLSLGLTARLWAELVMFCDTAADGFRVVTGRLDAPEPHVRLAVVVGRDTTRLLADGAVAGTFATTAHPQIAAAAQALIVRLAISPEETAIGFADNLALDLDFTLPKAPRRLLDQAIAARIAQETPYAEGEGLVFWALSRTGGTEARARVAIVPAHVAQPILEALDAEGARPRLALRSGTQGDWSSQPDWLALSVGRAPLLAAGLASLPRPVRLGLIGSVMIAASALANLAYTTVQASALAGSAQQAAELAKLAGKRESDAVFLAARQRDGLAKLQILNGLAGKLPDGSWFERVEIKDDKLELTGYGASAADTLALIAGIPGVRTAEIVSAVTRDQSRNLERFRLSAQIGAGAPAATKPGVKP